MVIALVGLIFILLLVFVLIIRGQSKKYAKKADSGERELGAGAGTALSRRQGRRGGGAGRAERGEILAPRVPQHHQDTRSKP